MVILRVQQAFLEEPDRLRGHFTALSLCLGTASSVLVGKSSCMANQQWSSD